jgi:hypothetical protein
MSEATIGDNTIKSKANDLFEFYERDYRSFHSSKSRAIAHCDRELRIISDEEQRAILEEVKKELKKNF